MSLPYSLADCQASDYQFPLFNEHDNYHAADRAGFFAILRSKDQYKNQRSYRLELMPEVIRMVDPSRDTYLSQAEFFRPNRRVVNLARIGLCFIDVDYYALNELRYLTPIQVAGQILDYANDNGLPLPSMIVSSGRGLYLKWFLTGTIPRQALPRWNALQRILVDSFTHFGADPGAKDASRVLRLEQTTNTKTGKLVRVIYPTYANPTTYDFEELCREVMPFDRHELRQQECVRTTLKVLKGGGKPTGLRPYSALQLNWDRLEDLRRLVGLRGGVPVGMRDAYLFLSTCFASWTIAPGQLYREAEALGREFCPGFARAQIHSYTSTAISRATDAAAGRLQVYEGRDVDPRYRFLNQTLIEWLHITPAEERQMQTIISKGEAKERDRQRAIVKRQAKGAIDRQAYLGTAEVRATSAKLMKAQGMKVKDIARQLEISVETVRTYLYRKVV
jgi:hypothetical protein